jgi:preprotein translocase subunit SecG
MFVVLMTIEIVISIFLIAVILLQASKGGGLAGSFGGGNVGMVFGVRRTADFLIRATQVLAATFIILATVINLVFLPSRNTTSESVLQRGSTQGAIPSTPQLPPADNGGQQAPQQ